MGHDVFVSHSAKDKSIADAVCAALEADGVRCWIAPRDIKPGENWPTAILNGIAGCRMMVLLFSSHTNESHHICREVERAVNKGVPIAPLRIEAVMPQGDLEYFLSSSHWVDALTPPVESHLREFTQKVRTLLEDGGKLAGAGPDPTVVKRQTGNFRAPPAPERRKRTSALSRFVMLVMALLLISVGAASWMFRDELPRRFAKLIHGEPSPPPSPAMVAPPTIPISPGGSTPDVRPRPPMTVPVTPPPATVPTTVAAIPPSQKTPEATTPRQRQLAALKDLFISGRITAEQYELGETLLNSDPAVLDEYDSSRRAQFAMLAEGKLAPDKLATTLSAIETPQQKTGRLNLEAAQRAGMLRKNRVASLLADARANQSAEKGSQGLAYVAEALKLDPSNAEALALKSRIESVMADAAVAMAEQKRRQSIATLLQQARDSDSPENGQAALASLDELLKLDSGNPDALALKKKIESYYGFSNSLGMTFVRIAPGSFTMGSLASEVGHEDTEYQHRVNLTKPFFMATTLVTQAQWKAVMGANPSHFHGDALPVESVLWEEAVNFCKKLSAQDGKKYRLPTEAEWEYCCRAGTTTPFSTGSTISSDQSNYNGSYAYGNGVKGMSRKTTTPVASYPPNPWKLFDMHGNVRQWCSDVYGDYEHHEVENPKHAGTSPEHVLRGGSWADNPVSCRSASRGRGGPKGVGSGVGFRVCVDF